MPHHAVLCQNVRAAWHVRAEPDPLASHLLPDREQERVGPTKARLTLPPGAVEIISRVGLGGKGNDGFARVYLLHCEGQPLSVENHIGVRERRTIGTDE